MAKSTENSPEKKPLEARIEKACRGLTYMSETDSPVEAFHAGKADRLSREAIVKAIGADPATPVAEANADEFFSRLTKVNGWYAAGQIKNTERFAKLWRLLRSELTDLHVYRVGSIRIEIFVVGLDPERNIFGIKRIPV